MQGFHIHLGVVHAVTTFLVVIIVGFFWRLGAAANHGTPWGRAMAFIY